MLVQLLRTRTESINELLVRSCCSKVDVCTGAIDEKCTGKERNQSYGIWLQGDFALKFWIGIMARNFIKQPLVNRICSNMQKPGIWMIYNSYKSINDSCVTIINRDRIVSKNGNCNSNYKYSQPNRTRWFSSQKETIASIYQRVLMYYGLTWC